MSNADERLFRRRCERWVSDKCLELFVVIAPTVWKHCNMVFLDAAVVAEKDDKSIQRMDRHNWTFFLWLDLYCSFVAFFFRKNCGSIASTMANCKMCQKVLWLSALVKESGKPVAIIKSEISPDTFNSAQEFAILQPSCEASVVKNVVVCENTFRATDIETCSPSHLWFAAPKCLSSA